MMNAVAERGMAKAKSKGGRPGKPDGEPVQVRINAGIIAKAKYLAAQEGISLTDFLSAELAPSIDRKFREAGQKLAKGED